MPVTLAAGQTGPWRVALDTTNVYWNNNAPAPAVNDIVRVPLGGGTVWAITSGQGGASGLALGGGNVFWTTTAGSLSLLRAPSGGGAVTSIATASAGGCDWTTWLSIAMGSASVYLTYAPPAVGTCGADYGRLGHLVSGWRRCGHDARFRAERPGRDHGGREQHALDQLRRWHRGQCSARRRLCPHAGLRSERSLRSRCGCNHLCYWADVYSGAVVSAPLAGGAAVTLATGQFDARSLTVDATSLYWANRSAGVVHEAHAEVRSRAEARRRCASSRTRAALDGEPRGTIQRSTEKVGRPVASTALEPSIRERWPRRLSSSGLVSEAELPRSPMDRRSSSSHPRS